MKVRCINDKVSGGFLKEGVIYQVKGTYSFLIGSSWCPQYLLEGVSVCCTWEVARFQVVGDDPTPTQLPTKYSNQCPCGIAAAQCTYHR